MRFSITVENHSSGVRRDVLVDAEPDTPFGDLVPVLQRATGGLQAHPAFSRQVPVWVDSREVEQDQTLREAGVAPGVTVALHEPSSPSGLPTGVVDVRIVSGPGAGRIRRLGIGEYTIGCGAPGMSLPDVLVPPDALTVRVTTHADVEVVACTQLVLLNGKDPAALNAIEEIEDEPDEDLPQDETRRARRARKKADRRDDKRQRRLGKAAAAGPRRTRRPGDQSAKPGELQTWPAGSDLRIGDSVLQWHPVWEPDSDTSASEDQLGTDFNRPPRLLPPPRETAFVLPTEPSKPRRVTIPWAMVVAPMFMSLPMAFLFNNYRFLMFALLSPMMALFNVVSQRRGSARDFGEALEQFREDDRSVRARIRRALQLERAERVAVYPDAATLLLQAIGPGSLLWSRRREDPDYLALRIGVADRPTQIRITDKSVKETDEPPPPELVGDVPIAMSLSASPVAGLTGTPEAVDAMARWMCGQAAILHSPDDLHLVVLTTAEREEQWGWVRWLPHARRKGEPMGAMVGTDQETISRRVGELTQLIAQRRGESSKPGAGKATPPPDVLVVLDGARRLRALPGIVSLLREGPAAGIRILCLDEDERSLPEECDAVLTVRDALVELRRTGTDTVAKIRPDLVETEWALRVARGLAPIRDTTPSITMSGLPSSARLLDCLGLPDPTPALVAQRWGPDTVTDVVIGAGFDGDFRLDIRKDGPHALIAGTTGSGKSELLQTIVASLAVANRPDQLTFVLVDYKGGSAFKDCALLPHTVGMVTDLDTHLVGRALTSLGAELRRREHLLAGPGAKDLEDYWALQRRDPTLPTIPRLLLVIDEFASLKAELPDFVTGLVTIAQRGRSLGIHLMLATQRPSGVISTDIRANTNLRIALRVTDESESRDVIDASESAEIGPDQPGRGYARLGHSSLLPFQAGRVGGARPNQSVDHDALPEPLAWPLPWTALGAPAPGRPKAQGAGTDEGETDLSVLVEAINGAVQNAAIPAPHSPWLPELPSTVTLADLHERSETSENSDVVGISVPWTLEDLPAEQAQDVRRFVLGTSGHLQIIGGPRSGRSTALRTLAAGLAEAGSPRDVHLYGLDCGNGALLPLVSLPHTGAIVQRTEVERAGRLLDRLAEEVVRRQAVLGANGYADIDEQRMAADPDSRLPYVMLLVDRWEGFLSDLAEVDMGRLNDQVFSLLREGASVGVHVVLAGDRNLLNGRIASMVEHRLILRLPDRSDFATAGIRPKDVPDHLPDGRGLWADSHLEAQVATLASDVSGAAQSEAVRTLGARLQQSHPLDGVPASLRPFRLEALPSEVDAELTLAAITADLPLGHVPLAVGGDQVALMALEAISSPALVVGPPRSGRTNTLLFAARHARRAGLDVLAFTPVPNALSAELGDRAIVGTDADPQEVVGLLRGLGTGAYILVDDGESLKEGPLAPVMAAVVRQAREKEFAVVIAGGNAELSSGFSGWLVEARKGRKGVVLSPQEALAGDIFGARVSRTAVSARIQPGRGVLFPGSGEQIPVQVPLVAAAPADAG